MAKFDLQAKIPRGLLLDTGKLRRAIDNALEGAARAAKVDFNVTTQSWKHKPSFDIRTEPGARVVSTSDEIYGYVDEGTPPHIIVARGNKPLAIGVGSQPKTRPRVIGSSGGSSGSVIFRPRVNHPGTEPREFSEAIGEKWDEKLPDTLQRAIDSEVA